MNYATHMPGLGAAANRRALRNAKPTMREAAAPAAIAPSIAYSGTQPAPARRADPHVPARRIRRRPGERIEHVLFAATLTATGYLYLTALLA